MTAALWITLVPVGIFLGTSTVAAVVRLTRLVDAVERVAASTEHIASRVDDHEARLYALEWPRGRGRPRHGGP